MEKRLFLTQKIKKIKRIFHKILHPPEFPNLRSQNRKISSCKQKNKNWAEILIIRANTFLILLYFNHDIRGFQRILDMSFLSWPMTFCYIHNLRNISFHCLVQKSQKRDFQTTVFVPSILLFLSSKFSEEKFPSLLYAHFTTILAKSVLLNWFPCISL